MIFDLHPTGITTPRERNSIDMREKGNTAQAYDSAWNDLALKRKFDLPR